MLHPVHEGEEDWRVSDLIDLELMGGGKISSWKLLIERMWRLYVKFP